MAEQVNRSLQRRSPIVLVVGDVMCDNYVLGKIARISPEAPVPVFESLERYQALGGAGNVAANLRALGCEVRLVGVIGVDAAGCSVRGLLDKQGIADTWLLEDETRPTTEKTRLIAQQQQVLRIDQESRAPLAHSLVSQALTYAGSLMTEVDGVICSDYQKGVCTSELLKPLFGRARTLHHPIIVDPKVRDFSHYEGATVLTPNMAELELASGMSLDDQVALDRAVDKLIQQTQAQALLVTRGKDGMSLFSPPQAAVHIPARARDVFDVTGAGDTVVATFTMGMLCGLSLVEAAYLANAAAGIVVGKVGTAVVSLEELRIALPKHQVPNVRRVLQRSELPASFHSDR